MTVKVKFFASLVERTGCAELVLETEASTSVAGLWERLEQDHPSLAGIGFRPLVACDMVYAEWDRTLEGVREVAFLPPVSGG